MVGWTLTVTVPGGAPLREAAGEAESSGAAWEQALEAAAAWARAGGRGTLELEVQGSAGWGLAESMLSGTVRVEGNAGNGAAASLRGGTVVIRGDAAARAGVSMKGGTLILAGKRKGLVVEALALVELARHEVSVGAADANRHPQCVVLGLFRQHDRLVHGGGPLLGRDVQSRACRSEHPQQRQRARGPLDQCGFGACADLRVAGHHAICPVTHTVGLTRLFGLSEYC